MKPAALFAALAAIPAALAQIQAAQIVSESFGAFGPLNGSAKNFANDTSFVSSGAVFESGALYNVVIDIVGMTTYSMAAYLILDRFPADTNDTDAMTAIDNIVNPVFQQINVGLQNLYDRVGFVPTTNNPLPGLLADFTDVFNRTITAIETVYPSRQDWFKDGWAELYTNIQVITYRLGQPATTTKADVQLPNITAPAKRQVKPYSLLSSIGQATAHYDEHLSKRQYWGWDYCGFGGGWEGGSIGCKIEQPDNSTEVKVVKRTEVNGVNPAYVNTAIKAKRQYWGWDYCGFGGGWEGGSIGCKEKFNTATIAEKPLSKRQYWGFNYCWFLGCKAAEKANAPADTTTGAVAARVEPYRLPVSGTSHEWDRNTTTGALTTRDGEFVCPENDPHCGPGSTPPGCPECVILATEADPEAKKAYNKRGVIPLADCQAVNGYCIFMNFTNCICLPM